MKTRQFIFFTRDLARVQLLKIPSHQTTQRKIGNRTTERLLLGRFIFFHRVVGVFSFQDTSLERFNTKVSKAFTLIAIGRLAKCFTNSFVK
ncbi:5-methyltetrahydropteroyltriglutamate--homocysteine methyltransferase [Streptococcus pneumoniae]|nr:5-methyltetrahydropteroyltriglutamate--homocysteine methyltransferase [Streptococcus pneumoniae]TVW24152.1 5-methyltetrahydropteroyltriglutamate--homocysteine methyltransferase [Streptococcus pneumoniae]TVX09971.1 5-methyltetrahydropteroyltriglutamate--homocysteine methyltransferase [Streptococcus pneumoniae]TXM07791.1 5-methyltetrahydropteroyltriglutamate--homocysteine methyltransferase [Streptococcus pneumoniae]